MEESQFYSQHSEFDQIAEILLSIKPDDWSEVIYSVELTENESVTSAKGMILNSSNKSLLKCPPDKLDELTGININLFREYKKIWKIFKILVYWDSESEAWQYKVDYVYE